MSLTELHRKTKADDLNLQCMFHHYEIHNKFFNWSSENVLWLGTFQIYQQKRSAKKVGGKRIKKNYS